MSTSQVSAQLSIVTSPKTSLDTVHFCLQGSGLPAGVPETEFRGSFLSQALTREGASRVLHVGLGQRSHLREDHFRQAAGMASKWMLKTGAEKIQFDLRAWPDAVQQVVEGAIVASYRFDEFRAVESRRKNRLKEIQLVVGSAVKARAQKAAQRGLILGEATNLTRSVGNLPPNVLTPEVLAGKARELAAELGLKCTVWDEKALKKGRFGGILAVGNGSEHPPRFIVIEPRQAQRGVPTVAVVGKAMTFDSGGISIKPADRMEEMKWDKMGGCAVLGIVQAVTRLKLPIRLIAAIPSAENLPDGRAYRPSDLVRTWDGKVIEVLNTDAEGRVILADALSYVRETYKPDMMIDLATLTGACVVALGSRRAGLFTDAQKLRDALMLAGEATGDRVWPLPMGEEYDDQIRSDAGLVKNTGGREGGACTAASFLKHWAGSIPWAHLDIAGPAMGTKELPHMEKGATGFGVRLVTRALENLYG